MRRWISAVALVALGAAMPWTLEAARAAAGKGETSKSEGIDFSELKLLRAVGEKPGSGAFQPPKAPPQPTVMTPTDRFRLRQQLALIMGTKLEEVVPPRFAISLKQPGDTISLKLHEVPDGTGINATNPDTVHVSGFVNPRASYMRVSSFMKRSAAYFYANADGGHTYLFTCHVFDSSPGVVACATDSDYPIWACTHTTIRDNKLFVAYEASPNASNITLKIDSTDQVAETWLNITQCDITYVR